MAKTKVHGEYLDPSVISGQTQVTAVGADSVLIFDATDNALKKALLSDVIETVGSTPTFSQISASSDLTVDVGGDIILDADGADVLFKDGGTQFGRIGKGGASDLIINASIADKDIIFSGTDGSTAIDALVLDMSANGQILGIANTPTNPTYSFASDTNTGITRPTGDTLTIVTGGTERHRTGSTGKASWSAGAIGAVATQDRDFTFYTEGSTNGVDIRSNDYRNILLGAGGSSGAAMDAGYIGIYKDGSTKIALNANGVSYFDGGNFGIANSSPAAVLHVGGDGITVNSTLDVSRTAIFRTEDTGNYSTSGNNSAAHAATFMRGNSVATGDQVGHSYVFNNGGWSATAEIMAEVESASTAYSRLNFKTWNGSMLTRQFITSAGYVIKSYQPYIRCVGNQGSMVANQGTTADYTNWADQVQRGITRSGAVFTVPIAGEYLITYSFYNWINNSGPGTTHAIYLKKNNSSVQETVAEYDFENDNYSYYDNQLQNSYILNMAAGDTFRFATYADVYGGSTHTNMSAYLLG